MILGLIGLDKTCLWDDEALVAIISRNLLDTGRLTGWDGQNLLALRNGALLDDKLRPINSPLDFYVAAGSMALLGRTTLAARLPFLLAGIAALAVFWRLLARQFGKGPPAMYGLALLALSPAFLLNIRQCRYYALAALLPVLMFWAYRRCLADGRLRYFGLLAALTVLLFYASYLLAAFALALAIYHFLFHPRQWPLRELWKPALAVALTAAATLPYSLVYHVWQRPDIEPSSVPWLTHHATLLAWNLLGLNFQTYLPWMFAAIGLVLIVILRGRAPLAVPALRWAVLGLLYVVLISVISNQPIVSGKDTADARYLMPAAPFLAGFCGAVLAMIHGLHRLWGRLAAGVLLAVALCTTALTVGLPSSRASWLLPAYLGEISRPYPTAYSLVDEYLQRNARSQDVVMAIPDFANYSLMFCQGDRLRFGCLLNERTHLDNDLVRKLDAPLQAEENFPHWIIAFGGQPQLADTLAYFSRPHEGPQGTVKYDYRMVQRLDAFWFDLTRPDLDQHHFGPKRDFNPRTEAVYVFRRFAGEGVSGAEQGSP